MGGDAEMHQRSSSPLKRRASSMEPMDGANVSDDVDMVASKHQNDTNHSEDTDAGPAAPMATSVDSPDVAKSNQDKPLGEITCLVLLTEPD